MNTLAARDATMAMARLHAASWLAHLEDMVARWPVDGSGSKQGRWLGWMQATVVAACPAVTLEDMKQINMLWSEDPS
jgi:hypothetical protein